LSWEQPFFDPIVLPDGQELRTLRERPATTSRSFPRPQGRPEWQAAARAVLLVVECNGDTMLARIGYYACAERRQFDRASVAVPKKHRVIR
jgi:hypothetical protein